MKDKFWLHKEYPKSCDPNDFWGQIKRTVRGVPVSQDQINMIVTAIRNGLNFTNEDVILDIGCGNGALSKYFFSDCMQFLGVDFSSYLIEVAKTNFEDPPNFLFTEQDINDYVKNEQNPARFSKVLCYGVFSYLTDNDAEDLLYYLNWRFHKVSRIFIGNLPDLDMIDKFYSESANYKATIKDNTTPIGIWRSKKELQGLANKSGWKSDFRNMPTDFYAAHYRYDVVLERR